MRPVFFDEPNSKTQQLSATTYLWGKDFLVTPIVNSNVKEHEVYFPKNNVWFDFYTDEKFEGGQTKAIQTKENYIPTYVRAGAFIPMAKLVQSTDTYNASSLDVHYYYDESVITSTSQLYNDDGLAPNAFEKGNYELLQFESELEKGNLEIEFESIIGSQYTSNDKQINLTIHNINKSPKRIKVDNKKADFNWNESSKTLVIPIDWKVKTDIEIDIKLNK